MDELWLQCHGTIFTFLIPILRQLYTEACVQMRAGPMQGESKNQGGGHNHMQNLYLFYAYFVSYIYMSLTDTYVCDAFLGEYLSLLQAQILLYLRKLIFSI